jgi:hypothetical protein
MDEVTPSAPTINEPIDLTLLTREGVVADRRTETGCVVRL